MSQISKEERQAEAEGKGEDEGEKKRREEEKEENETGTVKRRCEGLISVEALKLLRGRCGELRGFLLGRPFGQS